MGLFALNIFDRFVAFLTSTELFLGVLWAGLVALSLTLLILAHTRWGQSRPLRKCFILSLMAHLLLAGYATTVQIVESQPALPGEPAIHIRIAGPSVDEQPLDADPNVDPDPRKNKQPWEEFVHDPVSRPKIPKPAPLNTLENETAEAPHKAPRQSPEFNPALDARAALDHLPLADSAASEAKLSSADTRVAEKSTALAPEPIKVPAPQRRKTTPATSAKTMAAARDKTASTAAETQQVKRDPKLGVPSSLLDRPSPLPTMRRLATAAESADSLAALVDASSKTTHGQPADAVIDGSGANQTPQREQTARLSVAADASRLERLRASSLDAIEPNRPSTSESSNTVKTSPDHGANPMLLPVNSRIGPPQFMRRRDQNQQQPLPKIYRMRVAADRSKLALNNGATARTEAAVRAALKWIAENQNADGRWESYKHQGGREQHIAGRNRLNAGVRADTGVTGLALLAMLASGHTHKDGPYSNNVRQGLEFLLAQQRPDGSLAGQASHYAAMYCHAMAAFALSEAYAMTHDPKLEEPVRRAIGYTLAAQDPNGGGWRYMPSNPGDTSQFGWQVMTLKSAELAGIPIPAETRSRMQRFLQSVSSGNNHGLAGYRPGMTASRTMTAEALTCRQFLGMAPASAAGLEAGDYILGHLPGEGKANFYYWYYATVGMYQLQGAHWDRWNKALRTTLVESQRSSGPLAGSWDPNTVWGGYGGRVYSTALGTLCLEVYYRFLPMYVEAAAVQRHVR